MISPGARDIDVVSEAAQVAQLGRTARSLAAMAGSHLLAVHAAERSVDFKKPHPGGAPNSNPVSEADRNIEVLLRGRLHALFPEHAIIGEEAAPTSGATAFTWVIDPVDGTTNFINGTPLFAISIGLLRGGCPVAGAIWCATTHAFQPGVYHAIEGGSLQFEGQPLTRRPPTRWRGLAAEPGRAPAFGALWDTRVLGCATLEFAWVAAGLLRLAYIPRPALWDVAAGMVLLRASGCATLVRREHGWQPFTEFSAQADLSQWTEPLLIGAPADLERAVRSQ